MLKTFRRLLSPGPWQVDPTVIKHWAEERGHAWRRVRDAEGCVVEGRIGAHEWRMEWGAPQRDYIGAVEFRMLAEIGLPKELAAMVLNRQLMELMEKAVYDSYIDDVQTRIETDTPAEMRWLVLYPKVSSAVLGRLRERYGAVSSLEPWMSQWMQGPLNDALAATLEMVGPDEPVVLTIGRGRLTLRTTMPEPDPKRLALWHSVFEHALQEAARLGTEWRDAAGGGQSTQPSAWSHSEVALPRSPDISL